MLAEAIDRIAGLSLDSKRVSVAVNKDLRVAFVDDGTGVKERPLPPPLRAPHLRGLGDLIAMMTDPLVSPKPEVYHNEGEVVLVFDREQRVECATMRLMQSARFQTLLQLAQAPKTGPSRELVRWLRMNVPGVPTHVLDALRKLDFTRTSSGKAHVQHGRESLGNSVEAQVQGADNFPEEFHVTVPVYSNSGLRDFGVYIAVRLWLDLDKGEIELSVHRDEASLAFDSVQSQIRSALVGANVGPVYYGKP